MGFKAKNFIFGNIPSENYGIVISTTGSGGTETSSIADVSLTTQKIYRRPKTFLYGVSPDIVLEFPIEFNSVNGELTSTDLGLISQWLFGQQNYKKLQVLQDDMTDVYFNCFITNPEFITHGNVIGGVRGTVVCDSPFAYTFPKTSTYTYSTNPDESIITFENFSQDSGYLYPEIQFTMDSGGGDLQIVSQEESRTFLFEGLTANEIVTVNNDLQIITSSLALLRLSKFNKNFLRFVPGRNTLRVTGDIVSLKLTYSFARKIGG